ncbi:MAG: Flp family type IVb pilin [Bacillota bacterium]
MMKAFVSCLVFRDRLVSRLREISGDDTGATVAEYALVLVLVTVAVIGVLGSLGDELRDKIQEIVTRLRNVEIEP